MVLVYLNLIQQLNITCFININTLSIISSMSDILVNTVNQYVDRLVGDCKGRATGYTSNTNQFKI